ncbi:beta-galactosidase, partial [Paraburkholderia graminis]|uniref:beta-galactosidase n=1 Tax=Paraburkholderia graminis TaxID=60548 RepID=UPI00389A4A37
QMHSGLNLPNNELSPGGMEVQQAAREIASIPEFARLGAPTQAATAVVFDYETQWMFEIQRHGKGFDYQALVFDYYESLRELGLDVDIVSSKTDLSSYRLVVVPSLAVIDDALVAQVERGSAQWVFGPRSGSKTEAFAIPQQLPPGALQRVLPMQVLEVESLRASLAPAVSIDGVEGIAMHWREHVRANSETRVDAQFADTWPAILTHGRVRYVAAWLSHALHRAVLQRAAQEAGIATQLLPEGLRIRRRADLTFAFNFGAQQVQVPAPANATFVLGQPQLRTGDVCAWKDA